MAGSSMGQGGIGHFVDPAPVQVSGQLHYPIHPLREIPRMQQQQLWMPEWVHQRVHFPSDWVLESAVLLLHIVGHISHKTVLGDVAHAPAHLCFGGNEGHARD